MGQDQGCPPARGCLRAGKWVPEKEGGMCCSSKLARPVSGMQGNLWGYSQNALEPRLGILTGCSGASPGLGGSRQCNQRDWGDLKLCW